MTNKKIETKKNEGAQTIDYDNKYLLVNVTAKRKKNNGRGKTPCVL